MPTPPADARSRLPAVFEELLREGGDGLFDAVERALVHAALQHGPSGQEAAPSSGRFSLSAISATTFKFFAPAEPHPQNDDQPVLSPH